MHRLGRAHSRNFIIAQRLLPTLSSRKDYSMSGQEIDDLISANMATGSGAGSAVLSGAGNSTSGPTGGFNPEEAQNDELVRARNTRGTLMIDADAEG